MNYLYKQLFSMLCNIFVLSAFLAMPVNGLFFFSFGPNLNFIPNYTVHRKSKKNISVAISLNIDHRF